MGKRRIIVAALVTLAAAAYWSLIARNISFAVGGSDSSGYMSEARMFASGRLSIPVDPVRALKISSEYTPIFVPIGFRPASGARMVPSYPPGLPIHFAVAGMIGGWERAPFYVGPIFAMLTLVVLFLLARELGLEPWLSLAAVVIFAAIPIVISSAVQPLSDVVATFWAVLAVWLALRSGGQAPSPVLSVLAGVAFAIGVWVRPTNLLIALPLAFAFHWRWRHLAWAAVGAIPLGLVLMWLNARLFGSAFATGYGTVGQVIDWAALRRCPAHHFRWIATTLTPIVPVASILMIFDRRIDKWARALLPIWFGVFLAFYSIYGICSDWWDMRFLLPGIPALILGTLLLLRRLPIGITALLVLAMIITPALTSKKLGVTGFDEAEAFWPATIKWAEPQLPKRAVVISGIYSGPFYFYAQRFTARWDLLDTDTYQLLRAYAANASLPWYAVTSEVADIKPEDFPKKYPGNWKQLGTYRDVTLWRLDE